MPERIGESQVEATAKITAKLDFNTAREKGRRCGHFNDLHGRI